MCKENKNNVFIKFLLFYVSRHEFSITTHACGAADTEPAFWRRTRMCWAWFASNSLQEECTQGWTPDVTWTVLMMSSLPYWVLNVVVALLSMEGQKALRFHQNYLNLCSEDEQRSYRFGTTCGRVINDRIFIFGWTIPLRDLSITATMYNGLENVYYGQKSHQNRVRLADGELQNA